MIGRYAEHSRQFLFLFAVGTTLVFALPLVVTPLRWARAMRFAIPAETDLPVYFGRCLGALLLALEAAALRAAFTGTGIRLIFEIVIAAVLLMIAVHAYGAFMRIQPLTETLEIGVWVALLILSLLFFPV